MDEIAGLKAAVGEQSGQMAAMMQSMAAMQGAIAQLAAQANAAAS